MTRVSLDGAWQFKDFLGQDWVWRDSEKPGTRDLRGWRIGTVPGSVTHDLWQNGAIPDPYYEMNSLLIEWIPARTWIYKRTFAVDAAQRGKRAVLCFEGVDYEAQFFLNGERLGAHTGMYTPARFEVTDRLRDGDNLIAVVIEPAPPEQPQVGRSSLVRTHKSRMTYWWDFCPRMVHQGIWDRVYIDFTGPARLTDVWIRPMLAADLSAADVQVQARLDVPAGWRGRLHAAIQPAEVTPESGAAPLAETWAEVQADASGGTVALRLPLDAPRLWWPNGQGEQPLYTLHLALMDGAAESDSAAVRFGVRHITWQPNERADPSALPYTLVVNGRRIYIQGWNWVPIDVLYGVERPDKLRHLLTLARRAGVNMLRIWGGGLIEKGAFYDLCDEYGILIWQEFIQSSSGIENAPPDDPAMIAFMTREAEQIISRRRNHPSLALWCGGNELQDGPERPSDAGHPMLAALGEVVARLDPDRRWLPTSPTGPVFSNSLASIEADPSALHDVHGPWEHQGLTAQYTLYNRGTSLLHSEFGAEGLTNLSTLGRTLAPENQFPVTRGNPVWFHRGAWWVKEAQWLRSLGPEAVSADLETLVRGTQFLQAEGVRYALESNRRRAFQNSGSLPWQFNEPYPMAACTSAVDYYGQPKPLYYAVRRAYAPILLCAAFETMAWHGRDTFEAALWLCSDQGHLPSGDLSARLIAMDGSVHTEARFAVSQEDSQARHVGQFRAALDGLSDPFCLVLSLEQANVTQAMYLFTRSETLHAMLFAPTTTLKVERLRHENPRVQSLAIENNGPHIALNVWIEAELPDGVFASIHHDNHFCVLPGQSVIVDIVRTPSGNGEGAVTISAWNAPAVMITR